jgi:chromosome segregation ATPase
MYALIVTASAFLALFAAVVAIGWLWQVSNRVSDLGRRVLASESIERVSQAADKAISFESRMDGCENRIGRMQNQLVEHEASLKELAATLRTNQQVTESHVGGLAEASGKIASLESRLGASENKASEQIRQLSDYQTKVNDFAARLESVEHVANEHGAGLAEAGQNIQTLTDEIHSLKQFRLGLEETRRLLLAAFGDK